MTGPLIFFNRENYNAYYERNGRLVLRPKSEGSLR